MRDNGCVRIAIIGSNGQVGAEVALLLASRDDVDLVPLARTPTGSAFLRYHGIGVMHGSVSDPEFAQRAFAGADVVVNFALAGGTPAQALKRNEQLIRSSFLSSPAQSTVVFFSTLAVVGNVDENGRRHKGVYSDLKLRNERLVAGLAKRLGRKAYVLRLGHVAGRYQSITELCREEVRSPPVVVPQAERLSNVTHTVTIADALLAIGQGRAGAPGRYDLVNVPQWTWRQVYDKEASDLGLPLQIEETGSAGRPQAAASAGMRRAAFALVRKTGLREGMTRWLALLPRASNDRIRAAYWTERAGSEIATLAPKRAVRNPAALWPALPTRALSGLSPTEELFRFGAFPVETRTIVRWPAELGSMP